MLLLSTAATALHSTSLLTVRVYLDKVVVWPVEVVQEVVVKLQHAQLGQLIYNDAYLQGSVIVTLFLRDSILYALPIS